MLGEGKIKNNNCFCVKVVDHYENPKNVGTLDKQSRNVGTGLVGAPACGDVMKLQVSLARLPNYPMHLITLGEKNPFIIIEF